MQLINETHFTGCITVEMNSDASEVLVLTLKATFSMASQAGTALAAIQRDIEYSDVYNGEPGKSSIRFESDVITGKTSTDVILVGHAFPRETGDRETHVMLTVENQHHVLKVFGDRYWDSVFGVAKISIPEPFEMIPLVYERSFGGADNSHPKPEYHETDERNPVGTGFRARHSRLPIKGAKLPNIENPKQLISSPNDRPLPAGFGVVAKNWLARRGFTGTYDKDWMRSRMPFLPADFNPKFYSAASSGLIQDRYLRGGEKLRAINASVHGLMSATIPTVHLACSYLIDAQPIDIRMFMDTVIMDTDAEELILIWHGTADIHGQVERLKWVYASASPLEE